jgi:hypothetical protein
MFKMLLVCSHHQFLSIWGKLSMIKQSTKSTEEVTNANLFSLLKTYMNEKLSGIENNLNDRAVHLANNESSSNNSLSDISPKLSFFLTQR